MSFVNLPYYRGVLQPVLCLRNDHLELTLNEDASAEFVDLATGTRWSMGRVALQEEGPIEVGHVWPRSERSICEQFPGRFRIQAVGGDSLRVTVLGRLGEPVGDFRLRVSLDGPWAEFRIDEVGEELPSLVFPPPIVSESLVLPRSIGQWVRQPLSSRYFYSLYGHLTMRWVGGLSGEQGWIAIFSEGHADAGAMVTEMTAAPGWLRSLGKWTGERAVRYGFTSGGYVGLAKRYRAWAIEHGLHRPLGDKLAERPALRSLVGGRILSFMQASPTHPENFEGRMVPVPAEIREHAETVRVRHTHADVQRLLRAAESEGVHGLAVIRGWIRGGYDETHPDIWPPEPALGSIEELRALPSASPSFPLALHDNYQDIYAQCPSFPNGVIRGVDGKPMAGGLWAGGQAFILNPRDGLRYARRNWPEIATLGAQGIFPDTVTAVRLYESHEPGNETTRAEDESLKIELLQFYREQGQIVGSEEAADFGVPYVDWLENRHSRLAGVSIPLWPLVFGDACFHARYAHGAVLGEPEPRWLTDMLWGYVYLQGQHDGDHPHRQVDDWNAHVAGVEMLSHAYLDSDGLVERTEWANGCALTANFGLAEFDGIEAGSYRIDGLPASTTDSGIGAP